MTCSLELNAINPFTAAHCNEEKSPVKELTIPLLPCLASRFGNAPTVFARVSSHPLCPAAAGKEAFSHGHQAYRAPSATRACGGAAMRCQPWAAGHGRCREGRKGSGSLGGKDCCPPHVTEPYEAAGTRC